MCGILVLVDPGGVDAERARAARDTLIRRGPDDAGELTGSIDGVPLYLGHRRLSILGLDPRNRQPFTRGRVRLVFNGEIYNFVELRAELRAEGVSIEDEHSDTEVLAAGLDRHGEAFLARLNGMFAGCVWFEDEAHLVLFRDPTGQKPLWLHREGARLIAASEPKALLALRPLELDEDKLLQGLLVSYHTDGGVWRGMETLTPGHALYWSPSAPEEAPRPIPFEVRAEDDDPRGAVPGDARARLERTLERAVERHLRADVPLGLFLSGGIDSTLNLLALKRLGKTPTCFTIGFTDVENDESAYARRAAEHFGAPFETETVDAPDFQTTCAILDYYDEPFYDSSAVPTALLNRMAARHVTVVLGGDGGDEAFCGYRRYVYQVFLARLEARLGRTGRASALALLRRLGPRRIRRSKYLENAGYDAAETLFRNSHDLGLLELLRDGRREPVYRGALERWRAPFDAAARALGDGRGVAADPRFYFLGDAQRYLPGDILTKADRSSMMHSIEQRAPLLDAELLRLAAELPVREKVRGLEGKVVLKELVAAELGRDFAYRRKQGFVFPIRPFLVRHEGPIRETILRGVPADLLDPAPLLAEPFASSPAPILDRVWKLFVLGRFFAAA